jgi:hypothetical protein
MAIVFLIMMALLPSLMHRHLHRCWLALLPLLIVIALVLMVPLQLMCRHLCHRCNCNCWPHDDRIVAIVNAQVSFLWSSWRHSPCNNGAVTLDPQQHCFSYWDGIVAIHKLSSLPLLQWCLCHHQCTGILTIITIALLPSLRWHSCR